MCFALHHVLTYSINPAKIESSAIRERTAGIEDLKYLCRASPGIKTLGSKAHNVLFEALFRLLSNEKSAFVKASKSTTKTYAASRLSSYADGFRVSVEARVPRLRSAKVTVIVQHIIQMLPVAGDDVLCEPIAFSYLKALAAITAYQPHVEHLPREEWHATLELCLEAIVGLGDFTDLEVSTQDATIQPNASSSRAVRSFNHGSQPHSRQSGGSSINISTLWQIINHLLQVSNAPIMEKFEIILNTITDFLSHNPRSSGIREVFSSFNIVLNRVSLERCSFAAKVIKSAIPIVKLCWQTKDAELKDELLKTLIIGKPLLMRLTSSTSQNGLEDILEPLYSAVTDDYFHQEGRPRRHLYLEDLNLGFYRPSRDVMPMQESTLCLRSSRSDSEHNWSLLHMMAFLCWLLDSMRAVSGHGKGVEYADDEIRPQKRLKIAGKFSELLHDCSTSTPPAQVYRLQLLAHTIDLHPMSKDQVDEALPRLVPLISHSNSQVSSWAMVAASW